MKLREMVFTPNTAVTGKSDITGDWVSWADHMRTINLIEQNIEALEKSSVKVYRITPRSNFGWYPDENCKEKYTEQAWLFGIEPINQKVSKEEIVNELQHCYEQYGVNGLSKFIERIKTHGIEAGE